MSTSKLMGAGAAPVLLAIAISTIASTQASAAVFGNQGQPTATQTETPAQTPPAADAAPPAQQNDPESQWALVTPDNLNGGLRAPRQGDNDVGAISLARLRRMYAEKKLPAARADQDFADILAENQTACARTGYWIRESITIMAQVKDQDGEWVGIRQDLLKLGQAQNRASWFRRGTEVVSTGALCALSGGLYCASAAAGALGNEANGMSFDKSQKLNRKQSDLNARQSQLQLRGMVLTMDENIGWATMINWYCLRYHTKATLGEGEYHAMNNNSYSWSTNQEAPADVHHRAH